MATQEEILSGLAEIVNEVAGIEESEVQLDKSFTGDLDVDVELTIFVEITKLLVHDIDVCQLPQSTSPVSTSLAHASCGVSPLTFSEVTSRAPTPP